MKGWVFAVGVLLLCGCSFIVAEDQDISSFGIKKDEAATLKKEIERQRPEGLSGVDIFPPAHLK